MRSPAASRNVKGGAELGIFNISEIVPIKGVRLVGALPSEHQNYLVFSGGLHARGPSSSPQPHTSASCRRPRRKRLGKPVAWK